MCLVPLYFSNKQLSRASLDSDASRRQWISASPSDITNNASKYDTATPSRTVGYPYTSLAYLTPLGAVCMTWANYNMTRSRRPVLHDIRRVMTQTLDVLRYVKTTKYLVLVHHQSHDSLMETHLFDSHLKKQKCCIWTPLLSSLVHCNTMSDYTIL